MDSITDRCVVLRSEIRLATETVMEQVQACSSKFMSAVDKFEKSCREKYTSDLQFNEPFQRGALI